MGKEDRKLRGHVEFFACGLIVWNKVLLREALSVSELKHVVGVTVAKFAMAFKF